MTTCLLSFPFFQFFKNKLKELKLVAVGVCSFEVNLTCFIDSFFFLPTMFLYNVFTSSFSFFLLADDLLLLAKQAPQLFGHASLFLRGQTKIGAGDLQHRGLLIIVDLQSNHKEEKKHECIATVNSCVLQRGSRLDW